MEKDKRLHDIYLIVDNLCLEEMPAEEMIGDLQRLQDGRARLVTIDGRDGEKGFAIVRKDSAMTDEEVNQLVQEGPSGRP